MALFNYFPNYVCNFSFAIALESGAKIGEIVDMCQPIKDAADRGEDTGTSAFIAEWAKMAVDRCAKKDALSWVIGAQKEPLISMF